MSRWKELPDSLDPRVRQFVVQLRRIKDHSGLGLATLAARTAYSRSSWDRYLNGKALPPAEAVEALARACAADPARLLAQREVAAEAWGTTGQESGQESEQETDQEIDQETDREERSGESGVEPRAAAGRLRRVPWVAVVVSSLTTAAVILGALVLIAPWEDDEGSADADKPYTGEPHPEYGEFTYEPGKRYDCEVRRDDDGRLYAGYSRTRTELIERLSTRWSVVEAQCLLLYRGQNLGVADGAFGNATERAVKRIQDQGNIAVDGKVGPDTWKVLRK
ncbi:helix-turn-helix domain-containing protein [Streptomyces monticola]|uniref:Helix-turn-helix domain-containing protein n=1 Tax=Streptomyces monticola TaxID=2666263 RepID=A0ABW2JP19_9ACTN